MDGIARLLQATKASLIRKNSVRHEPSPQEEAPAPTIFSFNVSIITSSSPGAKKSDRTTCNRQEFMKFVFKTALISQNRKNSSLNITAYHAADGSDLGQIIVSVAD